MTLLHVAAGGALGAVLRYLFALSVTFPYATVIVNVVGSFVMGVAFVLLAETAVAGGERWQPLVMTGLLGGFTTFSAFSLDTLKLVQADQGLAAAAYVFGTVLACLAAVALGVALTRSLT